MTELWCERARLLCPQLPRKEQEIVYKLINTVNSATRRPLNPLSPVVLNNYDLIWLKKLQLSSTPRKCKRGSSLYGIAHNYLRISATRRLMQDGKCLIYAFVEAHKIPVFMLVNAPMKILTLAAIGIMSYLPFSKPDTTRLS